MPPVRLGPHIINSTGRALEWAGSANIIKSLNPDALRAVRPGSITVYRHYFPYQDLTQNPQEVARAIIDGLGGFRPSYVEIYNEIAQRLGQGLEQHVAFTRQVTNYLHAAGLQVAGFSFSTGNPGCYPFYPNDPPDWLYIRDQGYAGVDALSVHEYWNNEIVTTGAFPPDHALRHRIAHQILGAGHPPFIISECGRDAIRTNDPAGWKLAGITPEQYVNELFAYDRELINDQSYVLGGTVFTAGPTPDWGNFDVDALVPLIIGGGGPPPGPGGGQGLAMVLGLLAMSAAGLILLARLTTQGGELRVTDLRELRPGEAVPPGYTIVSP